MVANINLLPEEFRKREERERSRMPEGNQGPALTYTNPASQQPPKPIQPIKSKKSFFASLRGLMPRRKNTEKEIKQNFTAMPQRPIPPPPPMPRPAPTPILPKTESVSPPPIIPTPPKPEPQAEPEVPAIPSMPPASANTTLHHRHLDVNLIPKELSGVSWNNPYVVTSFIVGLAAAILVGTYAGIMFYERKIDNDAAVVRGSINELKAEIATLSANKQAAQTLQDRIKQVKMLLDRHVYWTEFFQQLEAATLPNVFYTNFGMAGTDRVILDAVGPNYEAVAQQIVAFQNAKNFVKAVDVSSAAADIDPEFGYQRVNFVVTLTLQPVAFLQPLSSQSQ